MVCTTVACSQKPSPPTVAGAVPVHRTGPATDSLSIPCGNRQRSDYPALPLRAREMFGGRVRARPVGGTAGAPGAGKGALPSRRYAPHSRDFWRDETTESLRVDPTVQGGIPMTVQGESAAPPPCRRPEARRPLRCGMAFILAKILRGCGGWPPPATAQNSTPGCALIPARNGCFTTCISVTRSASSISSGFALRPVSTTWVIGGFSSRRKAATSATSR